jgi:pyruvate dehydrogenase E2 component (dihydrolipoamide acetyltransferase)
MATAVIMPRQGNTVESCLLLEWKKQKGEKVSEGEIICEVETDKAVFEIEAPATGVLLDTFFDEGADIPVLTNIAVIGKTGESYDELRPVAEAADEAENTEDIINTEKETVTKDVKETATVGKEDKHKRGISPRAKRLASKEGVDVHYVAGSGPMDRIIERDIVSVLNSREPLTPAAKEKLSQGGTYPSGGSGIGDRITSKDFATSVSNDIIREEELKGVRKIIAERMLASLQNSAQLTLNSTADVSSMLALRETFKNSKLDNRFAKVNINDLLMYAVVKTLPKHPVINSLMSGNKIQYYENIHLGFAVDTERGLMVPTIKNAQNYGVLELSNEIKRLSTACRENKIQVEELSGGTFTVTNLGNMGIDDFTPVLNLPQTAILGISRVNLKTLQAGNEIKFVPHIGFSLTINHQVIDGADGARFLMDLADAVKEINLLIAL